jgi:hypothetical protein
MAGGVTPAQSHHCTFAQADIGLSLRPEHLGTRAQPPERDISVCRPAEEGCVYPAFPPSEGRGVQGTGVNLLVLGVYDVWIYFIGLFLLCSKSGSLASRTLPTVLGFCLLGS